MTLPTSGFSFDLLATSGHARRGRFVTPRATIETPTFMPVGTHATVKSLAPEEVEATGARIILANTYHLWLRPGSELVAKLGGVPRFMRWPHAMLTDSGGFQVFSLAALRKIDEDGVTFKSHLDGAIQRMTPEVSMKVQRDLAADVAMVLDVCPPGGAGREEIEKTMALTTKWAKRSLACEPAPGQARFGIVQGGTFEDLRKAHLADIAALPVDGVALGGFSVGEPIPVMYDLLDRVAHEMPAHKPRYLMGVGTPYDLLHAIGAGVDLFDCVLPTRNARNGQALTWHGRVNLRQARHTDDEAPICDRCGCPACAKYTRAYLRHLTRANEILGHRLLTQHNLWFYGELVAEARAHVEAGDYHAWASATAAAMREGDELGTPNGVPENPRRKRQSEE